jgi:hypothetical protein
MAAIYQPGAHPKSGATFCAGECGAWRTGEGPWLRALAPQWAELCCLVRTPKESKGAGKTGRWLAPASPCATEMHTVWTTGVAERPAFPARMVLTVSFVLSSGSDALLPPSPHRWLMCGPGRAATSPQDLTHRLRASGPHDFSVRGRPRRIIRGSRVLTPDVR